MENIEFTPSLVSEIRHPVGQDVNISLPRKGYTLSKVDLFTGRHTKNIIVGVLIISILLTLVFSDLSEKTTDRLLDALLALVGFFAGTKLKN